MSTCTKRVAVICNEIGLNYEIAEVDPRKGQNKSEEYVRNVHPFGIIPAFEVCPTSDEPSIRTHFVSRRMKMGRSFTNRVRYAAI